MSGCVSLMYLVICLCWSVISVPTSMEFSSKKSRALTGPLCSIALLDLTSLLCNATKNYMKMLFAAITCTSSMCMTLFVLILIITYEPYLAEWLGLSALPSPPITIGDIHLDNNVCCERLHTSMTDGSRYWFGDNEICSFFNACHI